MNIAKVEITKTIEIEIDIALMAEWFAGLDDERQADFFIEVSRIAKAWPGYQGNQWYLVGRHLKTCECSTFEARDMIEHIACGLANE